MPKKFDTLSTGLSFDVIFLFEFGWRIDIIDDFLKNELGYNPKLVSVN